MWGAKVPIDVLEVEDNRKIVLESSALGPRIRATIRFAPDGPDATVVTITESTPSLDRGGRQTGLGPERRMDPYFMRSEGLRAIRHQSSRGAQQEAYRRRQCNGEVPVSSQ
jgi:hypothetical protein